MAVVTVYSQAMPDPATMRQPKAIDVEGKVKSLFAQVVIANGDSIASIYYLGRIPSNARIMPDSTIICTAVTGAAANLGFDVAPAVLAAAQSLAAAGSFAAIPAVSTPNQVKFAWQLAGLANDPGGMLTLTLALTAAATAAGTVNVNLRYAV